MRGKMDLHRKLVKKLNLNLWSGLSTSSFEVVCSFVHFSMNMKKMYKKMAHLIRHGEEVGLILTIGLIV